MPAKKITKKVSKKLIKKAPAKKINAVAKAKKVAKVAAPAVSKKEATTEISKVAEIAKSLREFRFGAAGAKAKNTGMPKQLRRARAKLLTQVTSQKALAITAKTA